jgi:hypothetical protein
MNLPLPLTGDSVTADCQHCGCLIALLDNGHWVDGNISRYCLGVLIPHQPMPAGLRGAPPS